MRKARHSKKEQLHQLSEALLLNGEAYRTERVYKFTQHDLKRVQPLTDNQEALFDSLGQFNHVVANGSAGTGKTFLMLYKALCEVIIKRQQSKIIVIRSAVSCRDIGFLPGLEAEKMAAYEHPYHALCHELLGKYTAYEHLKKAGIIEFKPTSFLRGQTFNDCIVILDEAQNLSQQEINTVMTRIGENSRIFICADSAQTDLRSHESGYIKALRVWESMKSFDVVTFQHSDIVRSEVVKEWIIKSELIMSK
jgi:phosphate starvation-inducible protein PhoH